MRRLKSFGQYIAPDGTLLLANTNDPDDPVGVAPGLIAELDNVEQYQNNVEQHQNFDLGVFTGLKELKPGHIFQYNVKPDGYAYAERFTGKISVNTDQYSYDVTHAAPAEVGELLATPAVAPFHYMYGESQEDSAPSFHIDDLVEYDQDFWKSELSDLNL